MFNFDFGYVVQAFRDMAVVYFSDGGWTRCYRNGVNGFWNPNDQRS
jgi:hypothetical protein